MTEEPELTARLHGVGAYAAQEPDHRLLGSVVETPASGPLGRVGALIRRRPVVLLAAVAAGFLLGRIVKGAVRHRR